MPSHSVLRPENVVALVLSCPIWLLLSFSSFDVPSFSQDILINEFLAVSQDGLEDETGEARDWLEVHNAGKTAVNLLGWALTDSEAGLGSWAFPSVELPAGGYLVVFASGENRRDDPEHLHTDFQLRGGGEYLALLRPDGSVAQEWSPTYPRQRQDVSYGLAGVAAELVTRGDLVDWSVPANGNLGSSWTAIGFSPNGDWSSDPAGLGYDTGGGADLGSLPFSYYSFDGTLADDAGENNASLIGGSADYASGFDGTPGGAIDLSGAQTASLGTSSGFPVFNEPEFTIAMWVRGTAQQDKRIYSEGSSTSNTPLYTLGTDNNGGSAKLDFFLRTPSSTIANHVKSSLDVFDGTWHHIAWVDRDGDVDLWVDGVLDSQNFDYAKPVLDLDVASIGGVLRAATCCEFAGRIDDAAVWARALSAEEIAVIAGGASPLSGSQYSGAIETDVENELAGNNASLYLRAPFQLDSTDALTSLTLRMRYDDGFVAYLNAQRSHDATLQRRPVGARPRQPATRKRPL